MKKKILAALLCAAMSVSLLAGCGKKDNDTQKNDSQQGSQQESQKETEPPESQSGPTLANAEDIGFEPLYHFGLDGKDTGLTVVVRDEADKGGNTGANYGIKEDAGVQQIIANGPVGDCTYFDGKYGIKLPMESLDSNEFTISFWVNGDRMGDYGPVLQMGHNMGMSDVAEEGNTVTWVNFTQGPWSSTGGPLFPVVWNRNSANNTWPWTGWYDDTVHGKKEWIMVTLVATGEKYDFTDATSGEVTGRVRSKFYVNGMLVNDSRGENMDGYSGLAQDIFTASYGGFEAYLGINYWDVVFKGFMDEIYVYNKALTDGQVAKLFSEGNAAVESVANAAAGSGEEEKPVEVKITGTAVGETDCSSGFWTAHSETWKVDSGKTVSKTFKNYHKTDAPANWNNFVVVLQNVADAHSADANADYKEYGVVRADNYGWCGAQNTGEHLADLGWVLDNNWNFDTLPADMQGATVVVSVTNNGTTADVVADVTTADGKTYQQKYSNIAVDGDLYFCLTVDGCCLDIQ